MQAADIYLELKSWGEFSVTPFDNVDQIVTVERHAGRWIHCGNTNTDVKQQIVWGIQSLHQTTKAKCCIWQNDTCGEMFPEMCLETISMYKGAFIIRVCLSSSVVSTINVPLDGAGTLLVSLIQFKCFPTYKHSGLHNSKIHQSPRE